MEEEGLRIMEVVWYFSLTCIDFISGFMKLLDTIRIMKVSCKFLCNK